MLTGKKVILRPPKMEDMPKVNFWRNDLELVMLTQGVRFPKTLEMDQDWFNYMLRDKGNRNIYFSIDDAASRSIIGLISLRNIDYVSGTANWGFVIGEREYQGKQYTMEIIYLFMDYVFNTLNLRKLLGSVISCNKQAKQLHNAIGSVVEGTLNQHVYYRGIYHDVYVLSLFRDAYQKREKVIKYFVDQIELSLSTSLV